jgi:hypothetical protein
LRVASSSSASVAESAAATSVGRVTTFVSRLSREEKKKELPPETSRMSAENREQGLML